MEQPRAQYALTPEGHRKRLTDGKVHVNVDAGIIQQITPGGVKVCMYIDRPGEYWTIKGEPVPEAVAAKAGFQVEALRQQKQFLQDQAKAKVALRDALRAKSMVKEMERGPYALYMVGEGLAVICKDGERLTETPAPYAAMKELFDDFTADIPAAEAPLVLNLGKENGDARRA